MTDLAVWREGDDLSDSSEDEDFEVPQPSFDRAMTESASELSALMCTERRSIETDWERLQLAKEQFQESMKTMWAELHREQVQWKLKEKQAGEVFSPETDMIQLDIGGQRTIITTLATLRKFPDSALAAMFSGRHPILKHKGRALVDRDPEPFSSVISYLRTGRKPRDLSSSEEMAFKEEIDFWGIPLESDLGYAEIPKEFDPKWCAPTLQLEQGYKTVRKAGDFHGIVFTSQPLTASLSCIEFKVSLETESKFRMFLGLVDRKVYKPRYLVSLLWKEAPSSFYWDILNNKLIKTDEHGQHKFMKDYGCLCESSDGVFGVKYDAVMRTVSFYKSRISQGVAFSDVPEGLYPALDIWFAAGTVTIL